MALSLFLLLLGLSLLHSPAAKKLQECADRAGVDHVAVEQCQQEFNRSLG
jgi:hypothetical protein